MDKEFETYESGYTLHASELNEIANAINLNISDIESIKNGNAINITYDELVSLRDNGNLRPNTAYRITDYETKTSYPNTASANHRFDIIVTALDNHTLSEDAKAIEHEGEIYFRNSNLNAWELKYCLDNDMEKYHWVSNSSIEVTSDIWDGRIVTIPRYEKNDHVLDNMRGIIFEGETYGAHIYSNEVTYYKDGEEHTDYFFQYSNVDYDEELRIFYIKREFQPIQAGDVIYKYTNEEYPRMIPIGVLTEDNLMYPQQYAWGTPEEVDELMFFTNTTTPQPNTNFDLLWGRQFYIPNANTKDIHPSIIGFNDGGAKGIIHYMKDEWENEAYYDFKNMKVTVPMSVEINDEYFYRNVEMDNTNYGEGEMETTKPYAFTNTLNKIAYFDNNYPYKNDLYDFLDFENNTSTKDGELKNELVYNRDLYTYSYKNSNNEIVDATIGPNPRAAHNSTTQYDLYFNLLDYIQDESWETKYKYAGLPYFFMNYPESIENGWVRIFNNGYQYTRIIPSDNFHLVSNGSSTVSLASKSVNHNIEYTTDTFSWYVLEPGTVVTLTDGQRMYFRGFLNDSQSQNSYTRFQMTGNVRACGNINYLWNADDLENALTSYCGYGLFSGCTALKDISELMLPATTLRTNCYSKMFEGCTGLQSVPSDFLPATTLNRECYKSMFYGCSSLVSLPEDLLPATSLATCESCYSYMFANCTALTGVSVDFLPATYITAQCYLGMFSGCTSLTEIPDIPASNLSGYTSCYQSMFEGCTSITEIPQGYFSSIQALGEYCFMKMFKGCTSLEILDILPNASVSNYCCYEMFANCLGLTEIDEYILPSTEHEIINSSGSASVGCYEYMFSGCENLEVVPSALLPMTKLSYNDYEGMFKNCSSLISAPELNTTYLNSYSNGCYKYMFSGCTSLQYIKCLTSSPLTSYTENWVVGVSPTGTFVKNNFVSESTWGRGVSNIPVGWNLMDGMLYLHSNQNGSTVGLASKFSGYTIEYSTDNKNWSALTTSDNVTVNNDQNLYLRGDLTTNPRSITTFRMSGNFSLHGNLNALWNKDKLDEPLIASCGKYLFSGCTALTSIDYLELPSQTLAQSCYEYMFGKCSSLTSIPSGLLPATTLAPNCYQHMFWGCTSLTNAPELPAMILQEGCYIDMFVGCMLLETAPDLNAPVLVNNCYTEMFSLCNNLNYIKCLAENPNTGMTKSWVANVASSGTFVMSSNPSVTETQWGRGQSAIPVGWNVVRDIPPSGDTLVFTANAPSTLGLNQKSSTHTIEYSTDNENWSALTTSNDIQMASGDTVYVRGMLLSAQTINNDYTNFKIAGDISAQGNLNLLWNYQAPNSQLKNYCGIFLFDSCTGLTNIDNLFLPSTGLSEGCYGVMFAGCTSLISVPLNLLPATDLSFYCYQGMFSGCTSLTTAPELPATALTEGCYLGMFSGCTSLTTAPELPATALTDNCYYYMFYNCTSLTTAPEILPATALTDYCYVGMFHNCTSLTTAPELPATTLANSCYYSMFYGCTSLTTAPELPATNLAEHCYRYMFYHCGNLASLPNNFRLPAMTAEKASYLSMFEGCSGLTSLPNGFTLPATEVKMGTLTSAYADSSYERMFYDCSGLTTLPSSFRIAATALTHYCYHEMFANCRSLNNLPSGFTLPVTDLVGFGNCYDGMFKGCSSLTSVPSNLLPATSLSGYCYNSMFHGCSSLTNAPDLPATSVRNYCYKNMFRGCTSLTEGPELPALSLEPGSYDYMFAGCTFLSKIKCLALNNTTGQVACTNDWVYGVSPTGTFIKNPNMTSWPTGDSGIPSGWTVQDAVLSA